MTSQKYEQTRSCAKCSYEETRFLDELTAAFEETRTWEEPCDKCGSTDFGGSNALPPLSRAQLEIWAVNDELHFSQQDEDLILAAPSNLELLLEFLDSPQTHIWQRRTLASALYVLWYDAYPQTGQSYPYITLTISEDNSTELAFTQTDENYLHNAEFAEKVALEINQRTSLFIELGASKSEEFGEPLWYLGSYLTEKFEKHKP